ncbi:hypothetical protein FA95DRAFT_1610468 [Auriscalpium vulgare]|uniref:Uncharacterized protein n=1 Tax=Auriscalpium vulgare TaxID=40419 RepID=A0ACB8RDZ5_9AGAM|nr:hypothetical protein FA95DRAFT_1610468 [Auriscalpium vulgare]
MPAHTVRIPRVNLAAVLEAQNPTIDLRVGAFEASTRNFAKAIADWTNRGKAEIAQRRNAFNAEKKKIHDKSEHVQSETNKCKVQEIELIAVLEKEREEAKEAESSVAALKRQLTSTREACALLDTEIEHYRAMAGNLRREREAERTVLDAHASEVAVEVTACEHATQCFIEGVGQDQLLIRYLHISKRDWSREASFVLDVSSRTYKVITATPQLPNLPILLDRLNESRDVYAFIRDVRAAYRDLLS